MMVAGSLCCWATPVPSSLSDAAAIALLIRLCSPCCSSQDGTIFHPCNGISREREREIDDEAWLRPFFYQPATPDGSQWLVYVGQLHAGVVLLQL